MFYKAAYIFVVNNNNKNNNNNNNSPNLDLVLKNQTRHHNFDWRQSKSWDEPTNININWFVFKEDFDHQKCSLFGWLTRKFEIAKVFCGLWTTSEDIFETAMELLLLLNHRRYALPKKSRQRGGGRQLRSRSLASQIVSWMRKFIDHLLLALVEA